MVQAPLVSTIIAIGLIPVAFFFIHAFLSGRKKWKFHKLTGSIAVTWDLAMSIGYMLFRTFGGQVEGSSLDISGPILAYFIIHGLIAVIVILLEIGAITTGVLRWKKNMMIQWHKRITLILFILWWFAFLTGEIFYFVNYVF